MQNSSLQKKKSKQKTRRWTPICPYLDAKLLRRAADTDKTEASVVHKYVHCLVK